MSRVESGGGRATTAVRVLGSVDVVHSGGHVDLGGRRQRRLLGALASTAPDVVSVDSLVEIVWEGAPSAAAPRTLQSYVSRLRRTLEVAGVGEGERTVVRSEPGYALRVDADVIDAARFEALLEDAIAANSAADPARAVLLLDEAEAMWRGRAYAEFADEVWILSEVVRLEELRLVGLEERIDARIALGAHAEVIAELERLIRDHPLRERSRQQHLLALYRSGRQAEALRSYQDYRVHLAEELGLEPSDALSELEHQIAAGDADLDVAQARGRSVHGYQLFEEIGSGPNSAVFRGTQPSVGREVAVKLIRAERANEPEFIRAFEVEAQLVASLEHPHIVPLYDYWREPNCAFLVMRLMRGGRLDSVLERRALSASEATALVSQIGDALCHAHRAGVAHRDVRSANVLLDGDGNFYLGEFRIAEDHPTDGGAANRFDRRRDGFAADLADFSRLIAEALLGTAASAIDADQAIGSASGTIRTARPGLEPAVDAVDAVDAWSDIASFSAAVLDALGGDGRHFSGNGSVAPPASFGRTGSGNPYKGLRAFEEADADDFFGRSDVAAEMFDHVSRSRFLLVTGPSGAGKSSVVRAGLTPLLRGPRRFVSTLAPGAHPMDEIETALHRLSALGSPKVLEQLLSDERGLSRAVKQALPGDDSELVVIIDQFEELFTLTMQADRDHFLSSLAYAVSEPRSRVRVVATLRADFYDRPLQSPAISHLVRENTVAVSPLSSTELEQVITRPAARMGVGVDPALVAELVGEVSGQPSSLPLLQYALTETYERRVGADMSLEAYRELGGISRSIARRADGLHDALESTRQPHVRRLFTRLISLGEGAEDTRRRVARVELANVDAGVIDAYGRARLLTFDRDPATRAPTIEVAHEALIREWPRLASWLEEDRDGLRLVRHLGSAAAEWDAANRPESELYRGGRLEAAEGWASDHGEDLSELEQAYLDASIRRRDEQRDEERARVRRLRRVLEVTAVIAAIAVIAGLVALQQSRRASRKADEAQLAVEAAERSAAVASEREAQAHDAELSSEVGRLASDAGFLVQSNRQAGLLLAVEAFHRDGGGPVGVAALQRALTGLGSYLGTVGAGRRFAAVDWLGDDRLIAAGPDGTEVVSPDSGEVVARWDDSALVLRLDPADGALITHALAASADDVQAIVPSDDRTTVLVRPLSSSSSEPARRFDHDDDIDGIALSPGGTLLATIDEFDELRMYDVESGLLLWQTAAHPEETFGDLGAPGDVRPNLYYLDEFGIDDFTTEKTHHRIVFSADGAELITQESLLRRWDAVTGAQIGADVLLWRDRAHADGLRIVSAPLVTYVGDRFGDDVVVHDQSGVTRVDLVTGEVLSTFAISEVADAYALAKIDTVRWRGGPTVWVLLTDGRILTVSVDDGAELAPPIDTQVSVASDLAISPSGRRAAVAGASGVGIFALDGSRVLARGLPRNDTQTGSITPDGRFVTQDYANGEEWFRAGQIYDVSGDFPESVSRPDDLLVQHSAGVGNAYKVVTRDYGLRLLDLETREYLGPSLDISFTWSGQTATVDNRLLAAGTGSSGIVVYEVATGRAVATLDELGNSVASLSFNADGSRLAGASGRGDAMVWETETWTVVDDDLGGAGRTVISLRYSPYDDLLVTVDAAGNLALRDATTHDVLRIMVGSGSPNIADGLFFFGKDRRYLVTAVDSAARLWDLESGVLIGDPFPNDPDNRVGGADGMPRFVTAVGDHRLIWELDAESWPALACRAAGRNLTREEWDVLGPTGGYSVTCDEWPPAPEGDAPVGSFERPDPPTLDPALEELGIQARDELIVLLESGDRPDATSLCDDWWSTLDRRVRALDDATVASLELRAVIDASRLCGGRSFDAALTNLIEIREGNVCGGYPSPCPQAR